MPTDCRPRAKGWRTRGPCPSLPEWGRSVRFDYRIDHRTLRDSS